MGICISVGIYGSLSTSTQGHAQVDIHDVFIIENLFTAYKYFKLKAFYWTIFCSGVTDRSDWRKAK